MTCSRDPRIVWLAVLSFALPFTIVFLPAGAAPVTYSYNDYNSTQGFRGWTYWDSLGQPMVWNAANSRWTCVNPVDEWCYWSAQGGHPGADRNIIRRWTAPSDGSVRVAGVTKKDSNVCGGGTDGVEAQVKYHSQQSNWFRTTTIPGPAYDLSQVLATMGCNDTTSHAFDYDQEVYSGDTFSFVIDRRRNYSWDSTTLTPTITFEPADAIGSLSTYSSATSTTATVAFDGFLKCPNGSTCNYTGTFPPDYYTIQPVVFYLNPQQPVATLNNFALCGPADGPLCLNTAPPRFSRTFTGLIPNSAYRFKVRAYRGGHLYGRTQTITLTTGAIAPPSLSPTVSVTARGQSAEFGASDVIISWQAPAPPLDAPRAMERFELYRQTLGSEATVLAPGSQVSSTGEQLCASLNQAGTPAQHMCLSTTAVGGSCSTNFTSGNAMCGRMDPPVLIGFSRWDRNNVMQEWVNTVDQASPTRRTDLSTGVVTSVTDPGV